MKVEMDLYAGHRRPPMKEDVDKIIAALQRIIDRKPPLNDDEQSIKDTQYILIKIKEQLPSKFD